MARLGLANTARADLRAIRVHSKAAFGAGVAADYPEGLRKTFHLLGERPHAGAREADLGEDIRSFSYRSHRIFYRVDGGAVLIVRILHHARDAVSVLGRIQ